MEQIGSAKRPEMEAQVGIWNALFGARTASANQSGSNGDRRSISEQLLFLTNKTDEKLALMRHLVTSTPFDSNALAAYLTKFERYGNPLGPEKRTYILNSGKMMAPKLDADGTV